MAGPRHARQADRPDGSVDIRLCHVRSEGHEAIRENDAALYDQPITVRRLTRQTYQIDA